MGLVVVILFAGLFVRVNERSLGWISREKVNQVRSMMENHGFGFLLQCFFCLSFCFEFNVGHPFAAPFLVKY